MATSKQKSSRPRPRSRIELEKSAGAIVFHRGEDLEYLLIYATYWEFPKGMVEPNESEVEAAVREVREETGLSIELVAGFREEINYFYRRGPKLIKKQVVYFLGQASEVRVQVSWEHEKAQWVSYERALAELKFENARELLRKANALLTSL